VVDDSQINARLLASAEKIHPAEGEENSQQGALMHIKSRDLGQRTWALEFSEDDLPVLLINKKIPEAISRIGSDPIFNSLIIPQVMREVLLNLLWPEDHVDDEQSWRGQWKELVLKFSPDDLPVDAELTEVLSWIDDTVNEFCERYRFCDALVEHLGDDE